MAGMAPVVVAAAKWLPKPAQTYTAHAEPLVQTLDFHGGGGWFKPGHIIVISQCKWAGTYRMNEDGVFVEIKDGLPLNVVA
jgi:hypothetical protein